MQNQSLPEVAFLRINQIIGDKNHKPLIPVKKSTWYQGVKDGRYPKPVKLSARTTGYRVEDIKALI